MNAERSGHWRTHRAETAADRERWGWLWRASLPRGLRLDVVHVLAEPSYRHHPQDTGNCIASVKAAVDALVDVGFLPDDSGRYVRSITLAAPAAGRDALTIWLREPPT